MFIGPFSALFFKILILNTAFFCGYIGTWESSDSYVQAEKVSGFLRVVNYSAERATALATTFSIPITMNEEQKKFLLPVVENHQKQNYQI